MRRTPGPILLTIVAAVALAVSPARGQGVDASAACEQAAEAAERAHALPPGLLAAIGRVESGRWDPGTGRVRPWPWTLNVEGVGAYESDYASAVAAVAALRARGTRSIDIGCFQVNLLHHPTAFASLVDGFLPSANADYAARFLVSLRNRTGSWADAVAAYHSATPGVGDPYWAKVSRAWTGGSPPVREAPRMSEPGAVPGVRVWTPEVPGAAPGWIQLGSAVLPHVVHVSAGTESRN